jgi:CRISPR/Cas system-associated exonuclease Cas4 (RecB family)
MVLNKDEAYEAALAEMKEFTYKWMPENYADPSRPILKISKSSLMSYVWCPKKYEFSYVERLPQDQTEAMRKGTVLHNHREAFFDDFDVKKAEKMNNTEIIEYCNSLMPVDEYYDVSLTVAAFEAQRFIEALAEDKTDEFLPVINEKMFDCEVVIPKNTHKKFTLQRDYTVRLQGIIDRIFMENGKLIPFEYKTGGWKDYKATAMRKEMAFYQLMIENSTEEVLAKHGLTRDMEVSHWGWYYPVANHITVEPVKTRTMTSVMNHIAELIHAYENKHFAPKFYYKTCTHCSFFGICDGAQQDSWL